MGITEAFLGILWRLSDTWKRLKGELLIMWSPRQEPLPQQDNSIIKTKAATELCMRLAAKRPHTNSYEGSGILQVQIGGDFQKGFRKEHKPLSPWGMPVSLFPDWKLSLLL